MLWVIWRSCLMRRWMELFHRRMCEGCRAEWTPWSSDVSSLSLYLWTPFLRDPISRMHFSVVSFYVSCSCSAFIYFYWILSPYPHLAILMQLHMSVTKMIIFLRFKGLHGTLERISFSFPQTRIMLALSVKEQKCQSTLLFTKCLFYYSVT